MSKTSIHVKAQRGGATGWSVAAKISVVTVPYESLHVGGPECRGMVFALWGFMP